MDEQFEWDDFEFNVLTGLEYIFKLLLLPFWLPPYLIGLFVRWVRWKLNNYYGY